MRVLAGDLGGTKTLLSIMECDGGRCRALLTRRYESGAFDGLEPMVAGFLAEAGERPPTACVAIAGPVAGDGLSGQVTKLPWRVDAAAMAAGLGLGTVRLINDFQAVGYGIGALDEGALHYLQQGRAEPRAPQAVLGAGTGLGQAIRYWCGDGYEVLATEGGHTDFAPADEEQMELLRALQRQWGHVSWDRLVCGSGLVAIHAFVAGTGLPPGEALRTEMEADDPAAAVSRHALAGSDAGAVKALDLFVRIYGAQAGNLALGCLARGGVYLAGGIAPKILDKLGDGAFVAAFNHKGRMRHITEGLPVAVVTDPEVGLLGAGVAASRI